MSNCNKWVLLVNDKDTVGWLCILDEYESE
jgi:hypothetical protein